MLVVPDVWVTIKGSRNRIVTGSAPYNFERASAGNRMIRELECEFTLVDSFKSDEGGFKRSVEEITGLAATEGEGLVH